MLRKTNELAFVEGAVKKVLSSLVLAFPEGDVK